VGEGKAAPGNGGVKVQHHAFCWFRLILNKLHGAEFFFLGGGDRRRRSRLKRRSRRRRRIHT
jgi:hypothetical protein